MAGRLGRIIEEIQRQAKYWQAHAEAQTVHDKTFGTLKPVWTEVRLKEEMMRASQFSRPLSVMLLQISSASHVSTKALQERMAVLSNVSSRSFPNHSWFCPTRTMLLILPEYTGEQADELGTDYQLNWPRRYIFLIKKQNRWGK
jgi:hypothetical protein